MRAAAGDAGGAGVPAQGQDQRGHGRQGQQGRRHRQEVRRREAASLHIVSGNLNLTRSPDDLVYIHHT